MLLNVTRAFHSGFLSNRRDIVFTLPRARRKGHATAQRLNTPASISLSLRHRFEHRSGRLRQVRSPHLAAD